MIELFRYLKSEIAASLWEPLSQHKLDIRMKVGLALHIFCKADYFPCNRAHKRLFRESLWVEVIHGQEFH